LYGALLTDKQNDAAAQYYDLDYSLAEIADNLAISRQAVHFALKSGGRALERYERKLRFLEKSDKIAALLNKLDPTAAEDVARILGS
jgi:predicted DNA-binding protein YlxM (UPF0122 family)